MTRQPANCHRRKKVTVQSSKEVQRKKNRPDWVILSLLDEVKTGTNRTILNFVRNTAESWKDDTLTLCTREETEKRHCYLINIIINGGTLKFDMFQDSRSMDMNMEKFVRAHFVKEQIAKEKQVSGRVQIHIWYEADRKELIVYVFTADGLCAREDTGYGTQPEAYAKLVLLPISPDQTALQTEVSKPTQEPWWNATLFFSGVDGETLMKRSIEVTLWDLCPDGEHVFLGECNVKIPEALENLKPAWYKLEDPRGLRANKTPYCSPRSSFSMEIAQRLLRKTELRERSYSDDTQSDSGSPELGFLHPDHAWHANSRRGSSQSEQLEVEPYELNRDYSRSLPGSRRSSFQSQGGTDSKRGSMGEADMPTTVHYSRDRRRSSISRSRDPEKILEDLRILKAAKRELARTMSLSGGKRRESCDQIMRDENGVDAKLGAGQVPPKGYRMIGAQNGEVKLGLCLSKGTLEVEVICARDICPGEKEEPGNLLLFQLRGY
ncbi:Regulating synaptic membrane exocytosis protein 2 [Habropoda laboriosa]|uniref:Regulating synaptic membrane exocytosis protein 2 n=1 Tax=Habropoda laboriosa TaxID=597456 RepID=A0A0L7RIC4_9HYME|nr:Regulating synaptic membrane exocytosis protein 2 [Habropoda laboriosa]